jgi:hypothetical protein
MSSQYKGKEKKPTVVLEAVANQRLWIWHCFFGTAGALNDINVLEKSLLFEPMMEGTAWDVKFTVQNHKYQHAYYLVNGTYILSGPYNQLIGSLLWVSQCKLPYVAFAINRLSQHLRDPLEAHWAAGI